MIRTTVKMVGDTSPASCDPTNGAFDPSIFCLRRHKHTVVEVANHTIGPTAEALDDFIGQVVVVTKHLDID
ncbi:MAG: hypothetical protein ABJ256_10725 [Nisaea sp.]|uniref:hypothetical protein n=1 Tax=Nisaea sp. TaxID=2024842 RepID=UPI0032633A5B